MTRTQAAENLKLIGIAEPTDEQITNYLNQVNGESKREKDRADELKKKADERDALQKQLDDINAQGLSDLEKANNERDKALNDIATLQGTIKTMQIKNSLAENGIIGDEADTLIESINSGNFDASILGKIISDRTTKAAADKEKELLDRTPNPSGGQGGGEDKTTAEKIAESIGKSLSGTDKGSADIVNSYI